MSIIDDFNVILNNFYNSCYNVYVHLCEFNNIVPLSFEQFANLVNDDLNKISKNIKE